MKKGRVCKSTYEIVETFSNVMVKVPSAGCLHMQPIDPHIMTLPNGEEVQVEFHYRHGLVIDGVIVSRNFYVSSEARGQNIVATVTVIEKTTEGGKTYTMLDIRPMGENARSCACLKVVTEQMSPDDIPIINTDSFLHFKPMGHKQRKDEQPMQAVSNSG